MNEFNPGDGWRRLGLDDGLIGPGETYLVLHEPDGDTHFVREVPVPPLPTEPYTVVRVTWAKGAREGAPDILINALGGWCDLEGTIYYRKAAAESITGFEVLAEPRIVRTYLMEEQRQALRRETAKAVLDQLDDLGGIYENARDAVERAFGVTR